LYAIGGHFKKCCEIYDSIVHEPDEIFKEVDSAKQRLVFIDEYALRGTKHMEIQRVCYAWLEQDRVKTSLVVVCSMSSRYKSKSEKEKLLNLKEFFGSAWKKQEYLDAVGNQRLFHHVSVLDTDLSSDFSPSPEDLVLSKLYFAGGSPRWMFLYRTEAIIEQTGESVASVDNIVFYLQDSIGEPSNNAVNCLFSIGVTQNGMFQERKTSIISPFAGVMLAIKAGPDLIPHVARYAQNPIMDGWILEMRFFAGLCHGGVTVLDNSDAVFQTWPESNVYTLELTSFPALPDLNGVWFKPSQWNPEGFDAAFLEKKERIG
jgi:hypothetical protein